jgi:hypothetical protein
MKPLRSMIFEKDHLRRVNDWIPGDVVVRVLIAVHITTLPMRKTTLSSPSAKARDQWFPTPTPGAGRGTAIVRLPAPGSPLPLEREQAIEERAIAAECLPQILGCGLLAI